ncbi:MAG: MerR family transcriptional regulator [Rhodospirillales bacterium]|nr:MerR family transcriptional regulator [Rhodospirillales bacterium]
MSDAVDAQVPSRTSRKKSPDAFRTISEVADGLNVPQHVLRFWESKFTQVKPLKRGGGRRYYRPEDVHLLRGIRNLLYHEGYTIRGVQKVLREAGVKMVVDAGRRDDEDVAFDHGEGGEAQAQGAEGQSLPEGAGVENPTETSTGGELSGRFDQDKRAKLQTIISRLKELGVLLRDAG